jgi:DNA topoisomerase I
MNLIVVESPTKARTLSRFLGGDYSVEATMGHIKDLPKSKISIDIEHDFKPDYQIVIAKNKSISAIQKASKKAKEVYIATDPDREGEAIAKHVEEIITENGKRKTGNVSRIVFHEITKEAVEEAISNPGKVNKDLVEAQIGRRVLDRLVGYKLSPILWKKVRRGLSAGRVQTVAVRLIVEREREIEKFKPIEYWEIFVDVKSEEKQSKTVFTTRLVKIDDKKADVNNEKDAKNIVSDLKISDYVVSDIVKREVKKNPYAPFTTSTLTQSAARLFGWSAKRTMAVAQKLYEEGLITYHRTDSTNLAVSAVTKTREYIKDKYGDKYLPESPRIYKTKSKSAQEAHEAIRPTDVTIFDVKGKTGKVTGGEKLYDLIWKRFVACQMAASVFDETKVEVTAQRKTENGTRDTVYLLRANGQIMKFDGWRKVVPAKADGETELPEVEKDEKLKLVKVDPQQKFTQPPARYNEASLIKTLEQLGIGRPSTYAPTISTIQTRQYVEKKDGNFTPTLVGITTCDFLIKNFPGIFNYQFTAEMESDLDSVADGKLKWQKMMKDFYDPFNKKLKDAEDAKRVKIPTELIGEKCPTCLAEGRTGKNQGDLVIRTGRFGKFISCSLFPECTHTEKYIIKIDMKCPQCKEEGRVGKDQGEVIVKKTKKGRTFFGCSRYPDCEYASWKDPRQTAKNPKIR